MNAHPTDPGYLSRWLRTPRHATSPVDAACAVTVYQAVGSVQRAILGWLAGVVAAVLAFHFVAGLL